MILPLAHDVPLQHVREVLGKLEQVEAVDPRPFPTPAGLAGGIPNSPDLTGDQFHRVPSYPNSSLGKQITLADVEGCWTAGHESFGAILAPPVFGDMIADDVWEHHGTASLALGGARSAGVLGMAPSAGLVTASFYSSVAQQDLAHEALAEAAAALVQGDVLLIELHIPGPRHNYDQRDDQKGYVPLEWRDEIFNVVRAIVDQGVVVVAAAGNGAEDLDDPIYAGRFARDSGAIVVGAASKSQYPLDFSNHGSRVDCYAHGADVVSAGYGDRFGFHENVEKERWYTSAFGGTSSAAAIVAGFVTLVQGDRLAAGKAPLTAEAIRKVLRTTKWLLSGPALQQVLDTAVGEP